jgi:hypothetical protein
LRAAKGTPWARCWLQGVFCKLRTARRERSVRHASAPSDEEDLAQLRRHQATARPGKVIRLDDSRTLQTGTSESVCGVATRPARSAPSRPGATAARSYSNAWTRSPARSVPWPPVANHYTLSDDLTRRASQGTPCPTTADGSRDAAMAAAASHGHVPAPARP